MPEEHGSGNPKRGSESHSQSSALMEPQSKKQGSEHTFVPSSQPQRLCCKQHEQLVWETDSSCHAGCTPLFLSLSLRALLRGRLQHVLSSWAPCPQRKEGNEMSDTLAEQPVCGKEAMHSGAALGMAVGFPCGDEQNLWVPRAVGTGCISKL